MRLTELAADKRMKILRGIIDTVVRAGFNKNKVRAIGDLPLVYILGNDHEDREVVTVKFDQIQGPHRIHITFKISLNSGQLNFNDLYDGDAIVNTPEFQSKVEEAIKSSEHSFDLVFREFKRIGIDEGVCMMSKLRSNQISGKWFVNFLLNRWEETKKDEDFNNADYMCETTLVLFFKNDEFKYKL